MILNQISKVFLARYDILLPAFLIILFFFSTKLTFYQFLKNHLSIPDSFLLDQVLFLLIFLGFLLILFIVKRKDTFTYKNLKSFTLSVLLFSGFFIFLLNYQSEILNRYFIKDDQFVLLPALLRDDALDYRYSNKLDYFYYPFGASVLLFKFFQLNTYYYNVFILASLALGGFAFLKLLGLINFDQLKTGLLKTFIVIITLLYIVSPSIMDSFMYIEHSAATGYIIAAFTASVFFYIKFLNKKSERFYFILSFLLMLFLLKTATTRAGFLPLCLILLEIVYFPREGSQRKYALVRILLLFIPFFIMFKSFLFPSSSGRLYGISFNRFLNGDRIYLFFANVIPAIVPYQIMAWVIKTIKIMFLGDFNAPTQNFFFNHTLLISGMATTALMSISTFVMYLKNRIYKHVFIFWVFFLMSLGFFIFLGNVVEENTAHSFSESLKIYSGVFDQSIIVYPATPGSRYYPLPLLFFIAALYLMFIAFASRLRKKLKHFALGLVCLVLGVLVWSNINFTQEVNRSANEGIIPVKVITEKVLIMVPDNNEKKVIYSTSGRINDIEYIIRGFHGFFKYAAPEYFWQKEEMINYLKNNKIEKDNFFAFSFDKKTLAVEDKTQETKKEFSTYLLEATNTP